MTYPNSESPSSSPLPVLGRIPAGQGSSIWRGLLAWEWYTHKRWLSNLFVTWFVLVWILMALFKPNSYQLFGVVVAVLSAFLFGRSDMESGCQEFVLSLPPTRGQRYTLRAASGAILTVGFTAGTWMIVRFELAQRFWGIFFDSGLASGFPYPEMHPGLLRVLVWPVVTFSLCFPLVANAGGRLGVFNRLVAGGLLATLFWYALSQFPETRVLVGGGSTGDSSFISLGVLLVGILPLAFGARAYGKKEAGSADDEIGPTTLAPRLTATGVALLFAVILTLFGLFSLSARKAVPEFREPVRKSASPIRTGVDGAAPAANPVPEVKK